MQNAKLKFKIKNFHLFIVTFIFLLLPLVVKGATLYLIPQSQTLYQGDSFLVEVRLDTEEEEINAVEAYLTFPTDLLKTLDFIKGNSILTLWVEEPNIQAGEISFSGGIPNGFKGEGLLGKISFLGKEIGQATVFFKENSKVLLNDGKGTSAQLNFQRGNYEIIEKPEKLPVIISESHLDQNKWYKKRDLSLYWDLVEGADYSYLLSFNPLAEPDENPDRPEGELMWIGAMEYKGLKEDGIYYFTLKQKLLGEDWSKVVKFRAMIDTTSPDEFKPEIGQDPAVFEGKYFLSFATVDTMSGIDHYEVSEIPRIFTLIITKREWKLAKSPYFLDDQNLRSKILVKAIDKAGNERIVEIIPPYKITWKDTAPWIILILVVVRVIWWLWKKHTKRHKH